MVRISDKSVSGSLGTFPGKYAPKMHPRNFSSQRIVRTYYDVQKSVLHVQIKPIDLSITYN